jgi:hypothetical protein
LREGRTIFWFLLRAGHKDVTERRWRKIVEEDITAVRVIIEAALP